MNKSEGIPAMHIIHCSIPSDLFGMLRRFCFQHRLCTFYLFAADGFLVKMNLPASEILSTYVYRIGLLNGDYGYSTAVGLFNSVINVILLIFVNWVVKKLNDGEGL